MAESPDSARKRRRPRPLGIAVLGLCLAILIVSIIGIALKEPEEDPIVITGVGGVQRLVAGLPQLGNRLGQDSAPVTVQIFNDLQCKPCRSWQGEVIPPLIEREVRTGEAKLVFRHFSQSQRTITAAAIAATAAGDQGRQWQYIETFFVNQREAISTGVTEEFLTRIARASAVAFELDAWNAARKRPAIEEQVIEDVTFAEDRRLPAGPAVVVDGPRGSRTLIQGPSLSEIERAIVAVS